MRFVRFGFAIAFLLSVSAIAFYFSKHKLAELPKLGVLQPFSLIDQEQQTKGLDDYKGQVLIATFLFTRCQGPCPFIAKKMAHLSSGELSLQQNQIKFISITMDPVYDTPQILKAFGEKYAANFNMWTFLTGEKQKIVELAREAFNVPAGEDPDMHTTRCVLIDKNGEIRGYYDTLDEKEMQALVADAQKLASLPSS